MDPNVQPRMASKTQGVPAGWTRFVDAASSAAYLVRDATGEGRWETAEVAAAARATTTDPGTWAELLDTTSGYTYYHDTARHVSSWNLPPDARVIQSTVWTCRAPFVPMVPGATPPLGGGPFSPQRRRVLDQNLIHAYKEQQEATASAAVTAAAAAAAAAATAAAAAEPVTAPGPGPSRLETEMVSRTTSLTARLAHLLDRQKASAGTANKDNEDDDADDADDDDESEADGATGDDASMALSSDEDTDGVAQKTTTATATGRKLRNSSDTKAKVAPPPAAASLFPELEALIASSGLDGYGSGGAPAQAPAAAQVVSAPAIDIGLGAFLRDPAAPNAPAAKPPKHQQQPPRTAAAAEVAGSVTASALGLSAPTSARSGADTAASAAATTAASANAAGASQGGRQGNEARAAAAARAAAGLGIGLGLGAQGGANQAAKRLQARANDAAGPAGPAHEAHAHARAPRATDYHAEYPALPEGLDPAVVAAALSAVRAAPRPGAYAAAAQPDGTAATRARSAVARAAERRLQDAVRLQGRLKLLTIANKKDHHHHRTPHTHAPAVGADLLQAGQAGAFSHFLAVAPPPVADPARLAFLTSPASRGKGSANALLSEPVAGARGIRGTATRGNTFADYSGPAFVDCFGQLPADAPRPKVPASPI